MHVELKGTRNAQQGFTLLEMVIAISIFSIVGVLSYATLDRFLATREAVNDHNAAMTQLKRAIGHFERDIRFMTLRSVRDGLGEVVPALATREEGAIGDGDLLELTVTLPSYRDPAWHRLRRVGWSVIDGRLVRRTWQVLDRDVYSEAREITLLSGVRQVQVRYLTRDVETGALKSEGAWQQANRLPLGVELILTLQDNTTYRRLVEVTSVPL